MLNTAGVLAGAQTTGQVAREHVVALSEGIGNRLAGSPNEARAADYIEGVLQGLGYAPQRQGFSFAPETRRRGEGLVSSNVIALKEGVSSREIIVGAHYDSEVLGNGAGDNASGVGVMLEVASAIREVSTPYSIRFIAFGAEEQGLAGSRYYVSGMSDSEIQNTVAMINVDSVIVGEIAYVYGDLGDDGVVRNWVLANATEDSGAIQTQEGENPEFPAGTTCDCSDHTPFKDAGIQYAYFESTNWRLGDKDGYVQVDPEYGEDGQVWHTRFDTIDYIDRTFPGRADTRFELFSDLLYQTLTRFTLP
jgi:alkaline phosphatase isozyme conversion protein